MVYVDVRDHHPRIKNKMNTPSERNKIMKNYAETPLEGLFAQVERRLLTTSIEKGNLPSGLK